MKSKKGFTLIELLAIIVILAIIAVITVPIILNIIENSKKGAAKDSAYGYKDAVNKWYVTKLSSDPDYNIPDDTYTVADLKNLGVSLNGQEPDGNSWITIEKNGIKNACLQFDDYKVDITNGQIGEATKGECEEYIVQVKPVVYSAKGDTTPKTISDPLTDLTVGNYVTIENEGFYVISVNSDKVAILADTCLVDDNGTYRQKLSAEDSSEFLTTYFSSAYWCTSDCQVLKDEYAYDLNGNAAKFNGSPSPYVYYVKGSDNNWVDDIVDSYVETLPINATGRLLSLEEAKNLNTSILDITDTIYWLGSVMYAGSDRSYGVVYTRVCIDDTCFFSTDISNGYKRKVRPVIEISPSAFN